MDEEFISEPLKPIAGTFNCAAMTRGEPGLPSRFTWRDSEYEVDEVLEAWKETGPCKSGGPEMYLRKHWYRIRTASGAEMKLYFERQARSGRERTRRWWLYTISPPEEV